MGEFPAYKSLGEQIADLGDPIPTGTMHYPSGAQSCSFTDDGCEPDLDPETQDAFANSRDSDTEGSTGNDADLGRAHYQIVGYAEEPFYLLLRRLTIW